MWITLDPRNQNALQRSINCGPVGLFVERGWSLPVAVVVVMAVVVLGEKGKQQN